MLRAIREIKPTWVVGENVFGLVNWSDGLVFEEVCAQLEAEGYEVQPFILPAAGVNAPHKRDRVWFVAHANSIRTSPGRGEVQGTDEEISERNDRTELGDTNQPFKNTVSDGCLCRESEQDGTENGEQRNTCTGDCNGVCGNQMAGITADPKNIRHESPWVAWKRRAGFENDHSNRNEFTSNPDSKRHEKCQFTTESNRQKRQHREAHLRSKPGSLENFPTKSPICAGNDGIPTELDGITFSKWRNESIKAAGNAIVPQVALQIFKAIQDYETNNPE